MRQIDRPTVEAVEGRAPGACKADRSELLAKLNSGYILSEVPEPARAATWHRMCSMSERSLIPSLFTFFEDRKYLAQAADCLRQLVDVGPKDTIVSRLEESFTDGKNDGCVIQTSNSTFETIAGDAGTRIDLGLRQLWLAALREHEHIIAKPSTKGRLAKPRAATDSTALYALASLAHRIGFESKEILNILRTAPERQIAERALLAALKPGGYAFENHEECALQITNLLATAPQVRRTETTVDSDGSDRPQPPRRQGIPNESDHERNKLTMFLPDMAKDEKAKTFDRMTSMFIMESTYAAYFGQPPSTAARGPEDYNPTPPPDQPRAKQQTPISLPMIREGLGFDDLEDPSSTPKEDDQSQSREGHDNDKRVTQFALRDEARDGNQSVTPVELPTNGTGLKRGTQFALERLVEGSQISEASSSDRVEITFRDLSNQRRLLDTLHVHPSNPSEVIRVAGKYAKKGYTLLDKDGNFLQPIHCFEQVRGNGNVIFLGRREVEETPTPRPTKRQK